MAKMVVLQQHAFVVRFREPVSWVTVKWCCDVRAGRSDVPARGRGRHYAYLLPTGCRPARLICHSAQYDGCEHAIMQRL
jgi:hypothetical protein